MKHSETEKAGSNDFRFKNSNIFDDSLVGAKFEKKYLLGDSGHPCLNLDIS